MVFVNIFVSVSVCVVHAILGVTDKPDPPTDVRVVVVGNTTKISWRVPNDQGIRWSRIYLSNSTEDDLDLNLGRRVHYKDIRFPKSSFEIANLKICSKYNVRILFLLIPQASEFTTQTFMMTTTSKLTFRPEHPFVGNDITFTCNSVVHSCPGRTPSNLSYKFLGNQKGVTDNNTLTIHGLAKSDKGTQISCQVTDDLGIVFYLSDTVTLDPYYGPDRIILEPASTYINVKEGDTLDPLHCTTTCNPECEYQWEANVTGRFELVTFKWVSNQGRTLTVPQIKRSQTGTYRCHVEYHFSQIKKTADVSINVQYGPDKVVLDPRRTSINVTENSTLGPIHCTAACNPICTYQWKHNQTGRFELIQNNLLSNQNQTLTVPNIKRSQHGTFRCHVDYQYHLYHTYEISDVSVNVQYGPDRIILEPASTYINVKEGNTLGPIQCAAACNPECTYQWEYNVTGRFTFVPFELVSNQGRTLTVSQIQRSQTGTYRCHVNNYFTQIKMTAEVSITVQVVECPTNGFHAVTSSMFGVGIATLVVGLGALISATTFFIVTRVKTRNVRPNVSDGYIETQRSNPVFTDSYSTLQSNSESRPTQNPSSDMYEECGIAHGRSNYENI